MNNEILKEKATQVLIKMLDYVEKGEVFVIEQAPEVINQILVYNFWVSLLASILPIFLTLIIFYLSKKTGFYDSKDYNRDPVGKVMTIATMLIIIILLFPLALLCNLDWLQIWIAPKLYLIEYAMGLK